MQQYKEYRKMQYIHEIMLCVYENTTFRTINFIEHFYFFHLLRKKLIYCIVFQSEHDYSCSYFFFLAFSECTDNEKGKWIYVSSKCFSVGCDTKIRICLFFYAYEIRDNSLHNICSSKTKKIAISTTSPCRQKIILEQVSKQFFPKHIELQKLSHKKEPESKSR